MKQPNRKVVVFTTLMGVLTLTSALLLALAPAPLTPDASSSLFAIDAPESMDVIYQTQSSVRPGRYGEPSRFDTTPSSPSRQACS